MKVPGFRIGLIVLLAGFGLQHLNVDAQTGSAGDRVGGGDRQVWLVDLKGALGPAIADLIVRSIADAQGAGAEAVILRMDTPGGLDKSMRDVVKAILAADLPVVTFVTPDGARAASAGTYIAYASHLAAMAPATNIGSSTPVSIGGSNPALPMPDEDPNVKETRPVAADAMTRKVVNDAVAYLQSLAELRGRNIEWAELTVREGANLRASEAVQQNVVDLIATDVATLLGAIHGWEINLPLRRATLDVAGARMVTVETDWIHELLEVITDPSIACGLLIFGVYGLVLEFYNPGMIFPAVVGLVSLLLGAYGLQMLPVNHAGLALIMVGMAMMVAEVFTTAMGIVGLAGIIGFVVGSLILIDTRSPGYDIPILVIAAFTVSSGGIMALVLGAAIKVRHGGALTGTESMIGGVGNALQDFVGLGRVQAFGEIWRARSDVPVNEGEQVRVLDVDGITLIVKPEE